MKRMTRVGIRTELIDWALDRARISAEDLASRFPRLEAWRRGEVRPTLKQLESFAKATRAPVGYFFLDAPPVETTPIPDFRTIVGSAVGAPTPDLLDTIYLCQQRQQWYREFARVTGEKPLPFVGSARLDSGIEATAAEMRSSLRMNIEARSAPTWSEALRRFIEQADAAGVLVMCSGVVHNNNNRRLDPDEFRGFALVDPLAPVVFVNGADTRAAQMFTLAHELAHVWLGQSGISDAQALRAPDQEIERWCNRVAAELLVPLEAIRLEIRSGASLRTELDRLARRFKVSTLVILRRMHDAGALTRKELWSAYEAELERVRSQPKSSGGNFYLTLGARASKRFARAIVASTLEGHTSFTEAFGLLGLKRMQTFEGLGQSLGIVA